MTCNCKKIFKIVGGLIIVAIAALLVVASQKPDEFRYERSALIDAPPAKIFPLINNLHQWDAWSPWAKMDPNAKSEFSRPDTGEGASMAWDGNMAVGKGRMTITKSVPNQNVTLRLDFEKPIAGTQDASLTLEPQDGKTKVTWASYGKMNFTAKVMGTIFDCESMMNEAMDEGLANIAATATK